MGSLGGRGRVVVGALAMDDPQASNPHTQQPVGGLPTPWWQQLRQCAEAATPAGCSVGSFVKLECSSEVDDATGVPIKRCVRLHRRLLHCPGR